ncbi:MAG: hypothetical protein U1A77_22095 [Pirellulales bacterium]
MNTAWAAVVPRADAAVLTSLWHDDSVEVCELAELIWLRGERNAVSRDVDSHAWLRTLLPGYQVFGRGNANELTRPGQRIPCGTLPEGQWRSLHDWLSLRLPWSDSQGQVARTALRLERNDVEITPSVLSLSLSHWHDYAQTAPRWRLESLAMVVNGKGQVLLRGDPLPSLPGIAWTERSGVCVPSGWSWRPALDPQVLRRAFLLEEGDWAFLSILSSTSADCTWWKVRESDWVRATRASIRATWEAWCDENT